MIRSLVLDALAAAVDAGTEDAARARLARVDPLLRPLVRARVRAAQREAWLAVTPDQGVAHALRLAWLTAARATPDGDPTPEVVARDFAARRGPVRAPGRWWVLWTVTALVAVTAAVVALVVALAPADPRTSAAGRLLGKRLGAWVVALDRWGHEAQDGDAGSEATAALEQARAALLDDAGGALGAAPAAALRELVAQGEAAAGPEADGSSDALMAAVRDLDRALAAARLPYFVDAELLREGGVRSVIVTSFVIERERRLRSGTLEERLLRMRRLDTLNWQPTHLGFTRSSLEAALVISDQLDGLVVRRLLPSLAAGGAMPLVDDTDREAGAGWVAAVEGRAGLAVRDELGALEGLDGAAASRAGELLVRRSALVRRIGRDLRRGGKSLDEPDALRLPDGLLDQLDGAVTADDLRALRDIDAQLGEDGVRGAFATLHEAVASSVERHEAQHRLDLALGEAFVVPSELRTVTGTGEEEHPPWVRRAALELSAYLAEIARDDRSVGTNLALDARFALDAEQWGTPESYAILVMLEVLGEEAAVAREPMTPGHVIRRGRVAERTIALLDLPRESLRAAAGRAWERLFERPLPPLEVVDAP